MSLKSRYQEELHRSLAKKELKALKRAGNSSKVLLRVIGDGEMLRAMEKGWAYHSTIPNGIGTNTRRVLIMDRALLEASLHRAA